MTIDSLTTSGINSLVNSFIQSETKKVVAPLKSKQAQYNNLSSAYGKILNLIDSLKSSLEPLKLQNSDSIFKAISVKSSNENRITATATSNAQISSYNLRVNQLAKNDTALSIDRNSNNSSGIVNPGDYIFEIKTGDGQGNSFNSRITLTLQASDFNSGNISYASLASKINDAIKNDLAVINSNLLSGNNNNTGSFKFNFGGDEYTINYITGDYETVIDNIVSQLNNITGISAQKIQSGSNFGLKVTSNDKKKFIQFKDDTGSLLSSLGISNQKEIASSEAINSTVFSPISGFTQISISSKKSGYDFRILEISDITVNGVLSTFGLNFGTNRPTFNQVNGGDDIPGFVHQTNQLNAKITFNGVNVERNSNEINDLIQGVKLKLNSLSETNEPDVVLTTSTNINEIQSKIENFVQKFNELYKYLKDNTNSSKDKKGLLLGDSNANSLLSLLNSYAINSLSGFPVSSINSLTKLGITFNVNSGLSISNQSQLVNQIQTNLEEVEKFFNSNQGFAKKLIEQLDPYTGNNGYLKKAQNQLASNITFINDSITNAENRISKSAARLRSQYQKLQSQLASLISSQSYFMSNIFNNNQMSL
jgi:flagellar hook-associated protein 2